MGFLVQKAWTAPLPPKAEVVVVRGQRVARWTSRSGKVHTAEVLEGQGGKLRIRGTTKAYVARLRDASGVWIEHPTGCTDQSAARAVLVELERRVEKVKAGILSPDEDAASRHGASAVEPHIDRWVEHLRVKGCAPRWVAQAKGRVMRVVRDQRIKRLRDLHASCLEAWLADQLDAGMGAGTRNGYRRVCVTFANWCVRTKRLLINPLVEVGVADERVDIRRERRALTESELGRLLLAAQERPLADALTVRRGLGRGKREAKVSRAHREKLTVLGRERALIYQTLVTTGLRKNELASITLAQADLDGPRPCVRLAPKDEKNRRGADVPLRADLAAQLRGWLQERLQRAQETARANGEPVPLALDRGERLLNVPAGLIRIFDRDLVYAGLATLETRDGRQVVCKRDDRGRTIDVHALRGTFCTNLCRAGVPLRTAQAAMRHSDPSLTARHYVDPRLLDIAGAVEALPSIMLPGRAQSGSTAPAA